jgi:hypothetical protein
MANPTTNYGWPMPTSTDLVTDLPADFALFGQPVDTTLKALNPQTTLGDLAYRSATSNVNTRLGIGSAGQVLQVVGGVPAWSTAAGGKVLQVVMGTYGTAISNSTATYADTNLTASITPSLNTSKVLAIVTHTGLRKTTGSYANWPLIALLRGATIITKLSTAEYVGEAAEILKIGTFSVAYLDSPATTSATTYKTQFQNPANAASVTINQNSDNTSTIILMEIGA